jgi:hypothetical protein
MTATITIRPIRQDVADPDRSATHELRFEVRPDGDVEMEISALPVNGKARSLHEYLINSTDAGALLDLLEQLAE